MDADLTPDDRLAAFWAVAQRYAHVGDLEVVMGSPWSGALPPPAWTYGAGEAAAADLEGILSGHRTATTTPLTEFDGQLPHRGDLTILTDADGTPRALIRLSDVRQVAFGEITEEQARADGEPDLAAWRRTRRDLWPDADDTTPVVWERFTVLYQE